MTQLEKQIADLRQRLAADSTSGALLEKLEAAMAEYDAISERLGGDRAPNPAPRTVEPVKNVEGVVPGAPTGCTPTTATFTQSTPTPIPDAGSTSSTLSVTTADAFLFDLNLTTNLTHTFPGDLDITLMSPAGTIVTLTTDNGGTNDNVFNGTVFDDDADPDGQVPYGTNAGLVTDHPYVNLTTASPLVPEEAFAAFIGEDPNGTWTMTLSDDAGVDTGTLASWSLEITTLSSAPVITNTSVTQSTPTPIVDNGTATSTVVVAGAGTSTFDVDLTVNLTHSFTSDLDITLMSPAGTIVTLASNVDGGNDNVFNGTLFDDDADPDGQVPYGTNAGLVTDHPYVNLTTATPLVVEEAMGAFIGEDPNGTWTITIADQALIDTGTLASWTLSIDTGECCMVTCPGDVTQANDADMCGAIVNYDAPTTTGPCGPITCDPASGTFFAVGTTTVTCFEDFSQTGPEGNPVGASCTFTVTVQDTQAPAVTCPAPVTQANDAGMCSAVVNYTVPTPTDNCPGATVMCSPDTGSSFPVGTTTVTCTASDGSPDSMDTTCTFTVTVNDTEPPAITCPSPITQPNDMDMCGAVVNYTVPTPTDNCSATVMCSPDTGTFFNVGTTTVTCTATDPAGNTATCSFTVTVNDTQLPAITCPMSFTTTADTVPLGSCTPNSGPVTFPAPTVSDNCPGVGAPVCTPASGSVFPIGTTTVTCTVSDMVGNTNSCSFTVTVLAPFGGMCFVDDARGDIFQIVTDTTSPIRGFWTYFEVATGNTYCGFAEGLAFLENRSLTAYDRDNPLYNMKANASWSTRTATVELLLKQALPQRTIVLRDRNITNNVCTPPPPPPAR